MNTNKYAVCGMTFNGEDWEFRPGYMGVDAFKRSSFEPERFIYQGTFRSMGRAQDVAERASYNFSAAVNS